MGRLFKVPVIVLCLMGATWPAPVGSTPKQRFRLEYAVAPGLRCPAMAQLMSEVSSRMAHDPWRRRARRVIYVQVTSTVAGMEALIWVRQATGRKVGRRTFRSVEGDCGELMEHVAFHLALVMDPLGVRTIRKPREKKKPQPKSVPVSRPPTPIKTPGVRSGATVGRRLDRLAISVGGIFAMGAAAGGLSGGVTAQIRYRFWKMSVGLEGRVDLPGYDDIDGVKDGRVGTTLMAASVLPCFHRRWLAVCGVLTAGAIRGQSRKMIPPKIEHLPYLAGGVRVGAEIDLSTTFSLRVYGDLAMPVPVTFGDDPGQQVLWTTPVINGGLGLALSAGFL